ncbi:unnamed protein product [Paramecium sonneborni]|uniref:Uncharacterized protein n=1 Tax=Paramecium sonneborni TaxID=65129 RepID=A0A8S1RJA5_9CILI|nr:unnamed protein product [Paramecium sonneborni]
MKQRRFTEVARFDAYNESLDYIRPFERRYPLTRLKLCSKSIEWVEFLLDVFIQRIKIDNDILPQVRENLLNKRINKKYLKMMKDGKNLMMNIKKSPSSQMNQFLIFSLLK